MHAESYDFDKQDRFQFRSVHGMRAARGRLRTIAGVEIRHLHHFHHAGRAWHDLSGELDTLTLVLAESGGRCEARSNLNNPVALALQRPNHISFVPAQMKIWGYTDTIESVRELRLSFDWEALKRSLGEDLDFGKRETPMLMFQEKRALDLARMLAADCDAMAPAGDMYGEGLLLALLGVCFQREHQKAEGGLSGAQLKLVLDYMHEYFVASVSIAELAQLVDLSASQFARLFRRSTDMSPHQYLLSRRIEKAQELLRRKGESLAAVAAATGFADQSHLTRVFKRVTGVTPHAWRAMLVA